MTMTVGVIGLGIMGGSIAANLLKNSFQVVGCDIDETCCNALVSVGGRAVTTARRPAAQTKKARHGSRSPLALPERSGPKG